MTWSDSYTTEYLNEALEEVRCRQREGTWDENEPNLVLSLLAEPSLCVEDVLAILDSLFTAGSESVSFHGHPLRC